jgi:hypothetical protein
MGAYKQVMFERWEVFPHKFHCLFGFNEHFVVLIRLGHEVPTNAREMDNIYQLKAFGSKGAIK